VKLLELTRSYYPSVGGMEKYVHERTKIYERLSIEYFVLATSYSSGKKNATIENKNVKLLCQLTPYNIVPTLPFYLKDEYDVVSVNMLGRFFSDYAILHYRNRRQKLLLTPYFAYHTDRLWQFKKSIEKYLFPKLLKIVDALIVFSEYEKQFWIQHFGLNPEIIFVIPPYVENYDISIIDYVFQNRISDPYLLYVGRTGENKKTDLLLKAFVNSTQLKHNLYLTIRVDDVDPVIRECVQKDARIRFLGYVNEDEKNRYIKYSDGVVFPTSWESFGYVAFEASMWNKPLLCSNLPVLKELLSPEGVIWFENTVEDLTNVLNAFECLTIQERTEMGKANKNNLTKFSFECSVRQYEYMFNRILSSSKA
jgi:glycosyltransferase involved in cell wall biosynthesis